MPMTDEPSALYTHAEIFSINDLKLQKTDKRGIVPMNDHSLQIHR